MKLTTCASCGEASDLRQWRPNAPVDSITICEECRPALEDLNGKALSAGYQESRAREMELALRTAQQELEAMRIELAAVRSQVTATVTSRRPRQPRQPKEGGASHAVLPDLPGLGPPPAPSADDSTETITNVAPGIRRGRGRPPRDPQLVASASDAPSPTMPWEAEGISALEWAMREAQGSHQRNGPEPTPDLASSALAPHPYNPPPTPPTASRGVKVRRP